MDIKAYLEQVVPLGVVTYTMPQNTGLVGVDLVNGFCTPGAGNLAPPTEEAAEANGQNRMVSETVNLTNRFNDDPNKKVALFLDNHDEAVPEPPYPPHCNEGTGEEELVGSLKEIVESQNGVPVFKNGTLVDAGLPNGLESFGPAEPDTKTYQKNMVLFKKDCINGFVGNIELGSKWKEGGANAIVEWVNANKLEAIVVTGICTDICVMDFVLSMLSARNHGMMPTLKDIVVYVPGVSTYDLPKEVATEIGLPEVAAHPAELTSYMGLYFMQSRGAILADNLE